MINLNIAGRLRSYTSWTLKPKENSDVENRYEMALRLKADHHFDAAIKIFDELIDDNHAKSFYQKAEMVLNGQGSVQSTEQALSLLHCAAFGDVPEAFVLLGRLCAEQKNFNDARKCFEEAIESGYKAAWNEMGSLYFDGLGVEKDYSKAYSCYLKAGDIYDSVAMANVGILFFTGLGVPENFLGISRNEKKALACFEQVPFSEQIRAWNRLGTMYLFGKEVEKNDETARNCFGKLKNLPVPGPYLCNLGLGMACLTEPKLKSESKIKKKDEAKGYCNKAGTLHSKAALYLSGCLDGNDNKKNFAVTYKSSSDEWYNLGLLFSLTDFFDKKKSDKNAESCFKAAADCGDARANLELGKIYQQNGKLPIDSTYLKAFDAYKNAAKAGNVEAYYRMALLIDMPALSLVTKKMFINVLALSGIISSDEANATDDDFLEVKKMLLEKAGKCGFAPAVDELENLTLFACEDDWILVKENSVKTATF